MCLGDIGEVIEVSSDDGVPVVRVRTHDWERNVCSVFAPDARVGQNVVVYMGFVTDVLDGEQLAEAISTRSTIEGDPS